jgi:hypothetical protein
LRPLHPGISRVLRVSHHIDSGAVEGSFDPSQLQARYDFQPVRLRDWIQRKLEEHDG